MAFMNVFLFAITANSSNNADSKSRNVPSNSINLVLRYPKFSFFCFARAKQFEGCYSIA